MSGVLVETLRSLLGPGAVHFRVESACLAVSLRRLEGGRIVVLPLARLSADHKWGRK